MNLQRWFILVAMCLVCGTLQVAAHNAVTLKGYELGDRMERRESAQTRVRWLTTQVMSLESPVRLAEVSSRRKLGLVAWSVLPSRPTAVTLADTSGAE